MLQQGGVYEGTVTVRIQNDDCSDLLCQIQFSVEQLLEDSFPVKSPSIHGRLYRKPFVLDTPGKYVVRAVRIKDDWGLESSDVASAVYEVRPLPPVFLTSPGSYKEKVDVELVAKAANVDVFYTVRAQNQEDCGDDRTIYDGAIELHKPGRYTVSASCRAGTVWSKEVSADFLVEARGLGEKLRALPGAMVQGLLTFKGATQAVIEPRLNLVREAIASVSGTLVSQVYVELKERTEEKEKGVDVGFSVEAERLVDARQMTEKLTQPALVERVAKLTNLQASNVSVESRAQTLNEVLLALNWTNPPNRGRDYLDGSCLVYAEDQLVEVVDYRGAQSERRQKVSSASYQWGAGRGENACISHSGDVLTPDGGSHVIKLKLDHLPKLATDCFFVLSAYNCQDLSLFQEPRMQIFDAENPSHLLSKYSVADAGHNAAVVVCALSRDGDKWTVNAYGKTSGGTVRDYSPIEAAIQPLQAGYKRWRDRRDLVLLHELWHADRAHARVVSDTEDVVFPFMDLPPQLFRAVVRYL